MLRSTIAKIALSTMLAGSLASCSSMGMDISEIDTGATSSTRIDYIQDPMEACYARAQQLYGQLMSYASVGTIAKDGGYALTYPARVQMQYCHDRYGNGVSEYQGNCEESYDRAIDGSRCGRRAASYRPGGY